MKILQLISGDLGQGGAERLVIDLANAQAELGHDVTICCFRNPVSDIHEILPKNVKFYSFGKKPGIDLCFSFKLAYYISKENYDVVHSHLNVFYYLIIALVFLLKVRFIYTVHSDAYAEEPMLWARKIRSFFIKINRITFVGISDIISSEFQQLYKLKKPVPTIYNGRKEQFMSGLFSSVKMEVDSLKKDRQTIVFIAVGRVVPAKNYELMIDTFRRLKDKNVVLVIIGRNVDNYIKHNLKCLPENVHFFGGKSNVFDYLLCADCFIMSSSYEGLPISMIEAMSASLPIVSTPVGGIPDIVKDGENGYLSASVNLDDFIKAIERYMSDDEVNIKRIKDTNKKKFLSDFLIQTTAEKYISLYNKSLI